jgi:hypothetical protein
MSVAPVSSNSSVAPPAQGAANVDRTRCPSRAPQPRARPVPTAPRAAQSALNPRLSQPARSTSHPADAPNTSQVTQRPPVNVVDVALPPAPPVSDGSLIPNVSPVQITSSKKVMPLTRNTLESGIRGRGRGRGRGGGPISGHSCTRPHEVHIHAVNSVEGVANAVGISSLTPTSASRPVLAIVSPTRLPPCRGDSGSVRHSPMCAAKNIANAAIISGASGAAGIVKVGTPAFKRGKVEFTGSVFKFTKTQHVEDVLDVCLEHNTSYQNTVSEGTREVQYRALLAILNAVHGRDHRFWEVYNCMGTSKDRERMASISNRRKSLAHTFVDNLRKRYQGGGNPWLTRSWTT